MWKHLFMPLSPFATRSWEKRVDDHYPSMFLHFDSLEQQVTHLFEALFRLRSNSLE